MSGIATGTIEWAKVLGDAPVDDFTPAGGTWSINLIVDDKERKRLEAMGLKGSPKDANRFTFKKNAIAKSGKAMEAPKVVDGAKNPWEQTKLIGNGSEGRVKFYTYDHKYSKQYGLGKGLDMVQVTKHVPYGDDFDVVATEDAPVAATVTEDDEF